MSRVLRDVKTSATLLLVAVYSKAFSHRAVRVSVADHDLPDLAFMLLSLATDR